MPSRAVPRAAWALLALLALLAVLASLLVPARADADDEPADPLAITISDIDSVTINGSGPISVSGTITNNDDQTWSDISIYPFLGATPVTTEADLAEEAALPEDSYLGDRVVEKDDYAKVAQLQPSETTSWSLSIPRNYLRARTSGAGVYWFGVHALGADDAGRDGNADGRARTFLPLLPAQSKKARKQLSRHPERVAVVLPVRRRVTHQPDGRIANVAGWTRDLADDGRLGRLVTFGETSTDITWLLDPAVLDAVRRLAAGNPVRNLGPTDGKDDDGNTSSGASGTTSPGSDASAGSEPTAPEESAGAEDGKAQSPTEKAARAQSAAAAEAAQHWLDRLQDALTGHEVLALPYADPDLPAVAASDPELYDAARERAKTVLDALGIRASPAVAPPSGYLNEKALGLLDDHPVTLVSDRMIKGTDPALADVAGHELVTTSADAASGGPSPRPTSVIGLRQRIASQAALRLHEKRPLVVVLPDSWVPDSDGPAFFQALESTSWLKLSTVADAVSGQTSVTVSTDRLVYPDSETAAQLSPSVFTSVDDLIRDGRTLQRVLLRNDQVADEVLAEALTATSYAARGTQSDAAYRATSRIDADLAEIRVEVPPRVALSGTHGRFSVTVDNGLTEPITVRIKPLTDAGLTISIPDALQVPAKGRSTQLLSANATRSGAHSVQIVLTDSSGRRVGESADIPLRTGQVSTIIWWFVTVGCALLFGAIALRLFRRIRAARTSSGGSTGAPPTDAPTTDMSHPAVRS